MLKIAKFSNWQKFDVGANFFVISVTGSSYINRIAKGIPYILSYWSKFLLKNWESYGNFKIWPIFWPGDLVL